MISEEGILYILIIILGVSIGNLYGLKKIFSLEKKIIALEAAVTKKVLKTRAAPKKKR